MLKVLIVEDDPMVAELNRRFLEKMEGFELAAIAKNGEEALAYLSSQKVNLILLDIFMPGINGLELLEKLRQKRQGVDIIVVSAARDNRSISRALHLGAVDYLIKPFEFERLKVALMNYKARFEKMQNSILNQQELDREVFGREQQRMIELPKGLDRNTFKLVWNEIRQFKGAFTTEELAKKVGISRVSTRKYLDYLVKREVVDLEISYGSIGRPAYKFSCLNNNADIAEIDK